jgi:two-component system response regulator AtoC
VSDEVVLFLSLERALQSQLARAVEAVGYRPIAISLADGAVGPDDGRRPVLTIMDLDGSSPADDALNGLPGRPGVESCPLLVLYDPSDPRAAARATLLGADELLAKPVKDEDLQAAIGRVLVRGRAEAALSDGEPAMRLRLELGLWRSPRMQGVRQVIQQAAGVDITVLICGETGTGKEVVARAIHSLSSRHQAPFIKVNCAAVPPDLLESELFGHEKGAFTGAHQLKLGKFELANQGTILLDEIGELHPALQAKLLHVLQDGTFSRVGGRSTIRVNVRVLAATNRDLEQAVATRQFRDDLYYRLNVIQVVVPPLRERVEEIPVLALYFARRYARALSREGFTIAPGALERLSRYHYPGNVRELENLVKRMIVLGDPSLGRIQFPPAQANGHRSFDGSGQSERDPGPAPLATEAPAPTPSLKEIASRAARAAEREAMTRVLEQTGWNRVRAAKLLRISYRALLYKIKGAGLGQEPAAWRRDA